MEEKEDSHVVVLGGDPVESGKLKVESEEQMAEELKAALGGRIRII